MITHDVDEAVLLSDRVIMMTNGPAARIGEDLSRSISRARAPASRRWKLPNMPSRATQSSTSCTSDTAIRQRWRPRASCQKVGTFLAINDATTNN
jgi:ABC-type taurine transport system ATPase subunit